MKKVCSNSYREIFYKKNAMMGEMDAGEKNKKWQSQKKGEKIAGKTG